MTDLVNHPSHYTQHPSGIECIQITQYLPFWLGNAIKYVWRAESKNGVEDVDKALWYLERGARLKRLDCHQPLQLHQYFPCMNQYLAFENKLREIIDVEPNTHKATFYTTLIANEFHTRGSGALQNLREELGLAVKSKNQNYTTYAITLIYVSWDEEVSAEIRFMNCASFEEAEKWVHDNHSLCDYEIQPLPQANQRRLPLDEEGTEA